MVDANVGDSAKLIINEKWLFREGLAGNINTFVLKDLVTLRLSRQKTRRAISAGPVLTYGVGDHFCEAVIELDTDQISTFLGFNTRDVNGKMPIKDWSLFSTDLAGGTKTISFKGIAQEVEISGTGNDGRLLATIRIDITSDAPTVA